MRVNSVADDLARDYTAQVIGEAQVQAFDERGYLETLGANGHVYFIFAPVKASLVGDRRGTMSWCVFGVDPRIESGEFMSWPLEHFMAFRSVGAPVHEELLSLWFALKTKPAEFLSTGCDPLRESLSKRRKATSAMLRKIGRTLTEQDYARSYIDNERRMASISS